MRDLAISGRLEVKLLRTQTCNATLLESDNTVMKAIESTQDLAL